MLVSYRFTVKETEHLKRRQSYEITINFMEAYSSIVIFINKKLFNFF